MTAPDRPSRLPHVDALRGLALLGMLVVHFQDWAADRGVAATAIAWIDSTFFVDKFYPLFACLFGAGFAIQFARWGGRRDFVWLYLRRLLALGLFAIVFIAATGYHVLDVYAAFGLVLLLVRRWPGWAIGALLIACLFAPAARHFTIVVQERRAGIDQTTSNARASTERREWPDYFAEQDRLDREGTFRELASFRLNHVRSQFTHIGGLIGMTDALFMFLIGLLAVRMGVLDAPRAHRDLLIVVVLFGAAVGVFNADLFGLPPLTLASIRAAWAYQSLIFRFLNEQYLGLAYAAALLLAMTYSRVIARAAQPLADTGRLSLTNYVTQVVLIRILLAPHALGLSLSRAQALAAAVAIFVLQVAFSRWWMRRFGFGPLEWLWRGATFLAWPPMRRAATPSGAAE